MPGALILVVGPSGAGKDTLIAIARDIIGPHPRVRFPRRIVTRTSSAAEDHDTLTPNEFGEAVQRGAFAFWWQAHGLQYGLPASIDDDIRYGRTVVCNVSRGVVGHLRERYRPCKVVLVDAPRAVRAERLKARGRTSDGPEGARLVRASEPFVPDVIIINDRDAHVGGKALAGIILAEAENCSELTASQRVDALG